MNELVEKRGNEWIGRERGGINELIGKKEMNELVCKRGNEWIGRERGKELIGREM